MRVFMSMIRMILNLTPSFLSVVLVLVLEVGVRVGTEWLRWWWRLVNFRPFRHLFPVASHPVNPDIHGQAMQNAASRFCPRKKDDSLLRILYTDTFRVICLLGCRQTLQLNVFVQVLVSGARRIIVMA